MSGADPGGAEPESGGYNASGVESHPMPAHRRTRANAAGVVRGLPRCRFMRSSRSRSVALLLAALGAAAGTASGGAGAFAGTAPGDGGAALPPARGRQGPRITLVPASPVQGTLFRVRLEGIGAEAAVAVAGSFAGEPLHFAATDDGGAEALAAVPIEATGAETLRLVAPGAAAGGGDTVRIAVPITRGDYKLERLSVAPRFGREPDAATAARIQRETERAQAVSRASHGTPRLWGGGFVRPRASRVTSGFGEGREFNGAVDSRHMGTDFAGAMGEPVRAAGRGVVALVDDFYLAGNVIYIDHGAGLVTAYFHLSATDVAPGDTVEAGQVIGRVGATGRVTGPHLHWVARYGGISVDPLSLLAVAPAR